MSLKFGTKEIKVVKAGSGILPGWGVQLYLLLMFPCQTYWSLNGKYELREEDIMLPVETQV